MATLTNDEFAVVLLDIVADFHDGVTTKAEAVTALQAELPKFAKGGASVATAAQLSAAAVTTLNTYLREAVDWYAGTVDGGPSSDGYYPLTDSAGNEYLLPSPARLISDLAGVTPKGTVASTGDLSSSGNTVGDFYIVESGTSDSNHAYGWTGAAWVDLGPYQGPKGDTGDTGAGVLSGSGAPSAGTGADGDIYLDVDTGDIYGPKTEGAWGGASGNIKGDKGDTGAGVLSGSGAPSAGTGAEGDTYLDVDTGDTYGPKTEGAWGSASGNIKGDAATIAVGTVTKVGPADPADVRNVGTPGAAEFEFDIPRGENGWEAVIGIVADGERRVQRVLDWTGGEGTKPASGDYIGAAGPVSDIASAVDIRGAVGPNGWVAELAIVVDGERRVHQVADWFGGAGTKPAAGDYVGADGLVSDIADAVDVRGPEGPGGTGWSPTGAWDAGTTYARNDAVSHSGASYASIVDSNVGIEPGVTAGWASSWMVIADPGDGVDLSDLAPKADPEFTGNVGVRNGNLFLYLSYVDENNYAGIEIGSFEGPQSEAFLRRVEAGTESIGGDFNLDMMLSITTGIRIDNGSIDMKTKPLSRVKDIYWYGGPLMTVNSAGGVALEKDWDDEGADTDFHACDINVTDTSSGAGSTLLRAIVDGVTLFSVDRQGRLHLDGVSELLSANDYIGVFSAAGGFRSGEVALGQGGVIGWRAGDIDTPLDLSIGRDAADILAQRRGANPQASRIYNTHTDASNYERAAMRWLSDVFQIGPEAAGTGVERSMRLFGIGELNLAMRSADPADPAPGKAEVWIGDGTGTGAAGDLYFKRNIGGAISTRRIVHLDENDKLPESILPDSAITGQVLQGNWDAATNTPAIPAAAPANQGHYYRVSVAGSTDIDGTATWEVGDWIVSNGTIWERHDHTDPDLMSEAEAIAGTDTGARTISAQRLRQGADAAIGAQRNQANGIAGTDGDNRVPKANLPPGIYSDIVFLSADATLDDATAPPGQDVQVEGDCTLTVPDSRPKGWYRDVLVARDVTAQFDFGNNDVVDADGNVLDFTGDPPVIAGPAIVRFLASANNTLEIW